MNKSYFINSMDKASSLERRHGFGKFAKFFSFARIQGKAVKQIAHLHDAMYY